jgi:glutamyl-tRNA synthetase
MEAYAAAVATMDTLSTEALESAFNDVLKQHNMKVGQLMPLYRLFVAGRMQGPGMFDVSALLGREEVIARLKAGLEHCRTWA